MLATILQTFDLEKFKAIQKELMTRGKPEDPCGECGCQRKHHLPKPTYSYAKSGGSSGKSVELPCYAPISCDCPNHLCSCVSFREEKRERKPTAYGNVSRENRAPTGDTANRRRDDAKFAVPPTIQSEPGRQRTHTANRRSRKRSPTVATNQAGLFE